MGSRKLRLAALVIAGAGAFGVVGGMTTTAQATVVLNGLAGTFADEATCDASQAAAASTPGAIVAGCTHYLNADPTVNIPRAGWYYRYAVPGDSGCGIGCHTPAPPPPYPVPVTYPPGGGCVIKMICDPD